MELQELVSRARILFNGAPKRIEVFKLTNGLRTSKEIALKSNKPIRAVLDDLKKMRDLELIILKVNHKGELIRKEGSVLYDKSPILKYLSLTYFGNSSKIVPTKKVTGIKAPINRQITSQRILTEQEILDICRNGEDQIYEFKEHGIEMQKLSKEICAFANTKMGGIIFYGIEDSGAIIGSGITRQTLDQSLQNSIRRNISPSLHIDMKQVDILGHPVILITIPPWNRKDVYQQDGRVYIRTGTNVSVATPQELKKLHNGEYVV